MCLYRIKLRRNPKKVMPLRKVAVIGAGIFGIATIRQLSQDADIEVVGFERRSVTGGLWNYEESPDTSPYLSPCYSNLITNSVRSFLEYPDKAFHTDSRWPDRKELLEYMHIYCKEYGVDQYIRFNTEVVNISVQESGDPGFLLKSRHVRGEEVTEEKYDEVVVATGYYGKAVEPEIPGKEEFGGEILHSSRYRHPETYKDKRVLLIGSNQSAWEITWALGPHVTEIAVSHHQESLVMTVPENGRAIRADVKQFTQTGVILENGETVICDVVMYCTGYIPDFSFLDASCHTNVVEGRVENLYKMIVHTKVPGLYFTGMYNLRAPMNVAACQAKFISLLITGKLKLPSGEQMEKELEQQFKKHQTSGESPKKFHNLAYNQRNYCTNLEEIGGFKSIPSCIHSMFERMMDVALGERRYITMRDHFYMEPIDENNYEEIYTFTE